MFMMLRRSSGPLAHRASNKCRPSCYWQAPRFGSSGLDPSATRARYRLPAIYTEAVFSRSGGLISFGYDRADDFRNAASYVDRILRGEKSSDLPVQGSTKFELIVNLRPPKASASKYHR